jgi:hypothetical protein
MMLPRAGGRDIKDARRVIESLYERNVANWEADNTTFTKGPRKSGAKNAPAKKKPAAKKTKRVTKK